MVAQATTTSLVLGLFPEDLGVDSYNLGFPTPRTSNRDSSYPSGATAVELAAFDKDQSSSGSLADRRQHGALYCFLYSELKF